MYVTDSESDAQQSYTERSSLGKKKPGRTFPPGQRLTGAAPISTSLCTARSSHCSPVLPLFSATSTKCLERAPHSIVSEGLCAEIRSAFVRRDLDLLGNRSALVVTLRAQDLLH